MLTQREIEKEIEAIASIYPTAFDLYDEPLQRLAGRIKSRIDEAAQSQPCSTCEAIYRNLESLQVEPGDPWPDIRDVVFRLRTIRCLTKPKPAEVALPETDGDADE